MQPAHLLAFRPRRGAALLALAPAIVVVAVLLVAFVGLAIDSSRWGERRIHHYSARAAADVAASLVVESLWSEFERSVVGGGESLDGLRGFLDGLGIVDQSGAATPGDVQILSRIDLPTDADGNARVDGAIIESVRLRRIDEQFATRLELSTTAVAAGGDPRFDAASTRRTIEDVFVAEAPPFEGLEYVLLANNVNCILCHAEIDNAERVYNRDVAQRGTYARVRVGSLESLEMRSSPESSIAGSLYIGGAARDTHGNPITDWGHLSLQGRALDGSGRILEHFDGSVIPVPLTRVDPADPLPFGNLYVDYFGHAGDPERYQVDGALPDSFPMPFPDDGGRDPVTGLPSTQGAGDRLVDTNEFASVAAAAHGHASGGFITFVPSGTSVAATTAPAALLAGSDALAGFADGNVIMHGTAENPIRLSGNVAIAGDLVLSGVIEGAGNLQVRGNVFIAGDLVYADAVAEGARTFGLAANGRHNLVTIAAGKNVMVGDVTHDTHSATPVDGLPGGGWNFTLDELSIFNRKEWMKTQPTLPGRPVYQIVERRPESRELMQSVVVQREEPILSWQGTGTFVPQPVYEQRGTGRFRLEPVLERQQIGTNRVPIHQTIHHPADPPEPYGRPWTERVVVGYREVPVYGNVQVGTRSVEITERVQVGTRSVEVMGWVQTGTNVTTATELRPYDPPRYETVLRDVYQWVTPQHANPYYRGPDFVARYYALTEGAPAPIFNKDGHFDPDLASWISAERPEGWNLARLSLADPTNPRDPFLFDETGERRAVITALAPSEGWIDADQLRAIIAQNLDSHAAGTPLAIDAWLYSSNSIFGLVPKRGHSRLDGRLLLNGAIIAPDVGLLAPGGLQLNYDRRGRTQLAVRSTQRLTIQRRLVAPGSEARRGPVIATLSR